MSFARVAIVDDEVYIGELLAMALSSSGFEVRTFTRADDLIDILPQTRFDLILSDLKMPDFDGVELIQRLATVVPGQRIALMSGCEPRARKAAADLATASGLVVATTFQKPLDLETVVMTLTTACQSPSFGEFDIDRAIALKQLSMHYQPIFNVGAGRRGLASVEALMRWSHPQHGLLNPAEFLPYVRSPDSWLKLTLTALDIVAAQLKDWEKVSFFPAASVNLPPEVLHFADLPDQLDSILNRYNQSASRLKLELTEGSMSFSVEDAVAALTRLRIRGYGLAIDDYGSGFSSLQRLHAIPFDQIKIDSSFVTKADHDEGARSIVESSVQLAQRLGLTVCAEGIETASIMRTMIDCGCESLQGFGLCPPREAAMIELQYNVNAA
ncbi:EAL domain-containing response regulator [Acuticoccus sp. M5D2P5]|uniref:EAL domain-containing response regulator n=1 Tax=Acuticoccus kalidii TaxID=2910977 RepID=UPI001F3C9292|nr:EAL domain-containing response regulator [Acuticoccus kalidii]MCF3932198.1 EAL domain-containing response regulator [Acuticoccus kalidii]